MNAVVDGDSHFIEPLDLFETHVEPHFRDRAVRSVTGHATGKRALIVDNKPMKLRDIEEVLGILSGYGQKETGGDISTFDRYIAYSDQWQDMDARIRFLDAEGIECQVIYPSLGIIWEGEVEDPLLADALCRAYNRWAFDLVASNRDRLFPAAHISIRDPLLAVRELERVAKAGCRAAFIAAMPIKGKSFGHPDFDPIWACAEEIDLAIGLHVVSHRHYTGSNFHHEPKPGLMYFTMNILQDPRQALLTMVIDGVFERFPKLRVGTIEAMAGWVGEWLERIDYRYRYMGHTSAMKRPISEYFARNIWISGDPEERMFKHVVQFAGDDKFFIGSDYPHAEGFVHPVQKAREYLKDLSAGSIEKILSTNARNFYRL